MVAVGLGSGPRLDLVATPIHHASRADHVATDGPGVDAWSKTPDAVLQERAWGWFVVQVNTAARCADLACRLPWDLQ